MIITNCKVNHLVNPLGYAMKRTVFSWVVENAEGKKQAAARIVVRQGNAITADTGWAALDSVSAPVPVALHPRTRYTWTVAVRTDVGEETVSEENWFETGKMDEPWSAQWIGCDDGDPRHPIFSKEIVVEKAVISARLYICGLGLYEAAWNGEKIGSECLTPYCNDYNSWVQYQTYDVTEHLQKSGIFSVTLGNGWYKGRFGYDNRTGKSYYGNSWKLLVELHLTYADGTSAVIGSGGDWIVTRSRITFSNIYDGEHKDDTLPEIPPVPVVLTEPPKGRLTDRRSVPVKAWAEVSVKKILHTPAGETVLDMGQNLAGIFRLQVNVPRGQTVHLQFGEVLQGGNFYRDNLRSAKAEYIYVSDGQPHILRPLFTFYGYRFVKIEGIPDLKAEDYTALVLYSNLQKAGTLVTGNKLVNHLISNVEWSLKGNFIDVPTDCPQRDERMGWTGDAQVFAPTACYLRECYSFYAKYLYDLAQEQCQRGGEVPNVIPSFGYAGFSAAWGDAACAIPWTLYQYYGDRTILEDQYESMCAWVEYIRCLDGECHGWRRQVHYGDWLALDASNPEDRRGGTEVDYVADAMYYRCTHLTSLAAGVLGRTADAERYTALADHILQDIRYEYFTPSGRCAIPTQTGLTLAVVLKLGTEDAVISDALVHRMDKDKHQMKTGFVGTPLLCPALTAIGREDIAFELLLNEEYPGWLYEVNLGATTIWERWNSLLSDGSISSTGMNSLNHYAYGSILEWMFRDVAGLSPLIPGFRQAKLAPHICVDLGSVSLAYHSAAGEWRVSWEVLDNGDVRYVCVVPFGCTASLELPHGSSYELEAGEYSYIYTPDIPLKKKYSIHTPIKDLLSNPKARTLAIQAIPRLEELPVQMWALSVADIVEETGGMKSEQLIGLDAMLTKL